MTILYGHIIGDFTETSNSCIIHAPFFEKSRYLVMNLSNEEILKIAHLARIDITDAEIVEIQPRLSKVLTMIEQMDSIDTTDVAPLSHPIDATQRLRLDEITETNQRDAFQSIAPDAAHGLYFVPLVIE